MKDGDLKIKYKKSESIDTVLDKQIEKFLKSIGYEWRGSGFSIENNVRDIQFTKLK
ncbi:hypothetical protein LCGC14_0912590 [marine sediment metagenome]|uniref:Uncharacterized protein n=1 Tax=marine sediment metagenome TaxID=412755 RepID=A0A0F9RBZ7_9ZZZZ